MNEDELERALRGALRAEAEQVEAGPGDLQRLQQRIATEGGSGRRGGAGGWAPGRGAGGRGPSWLPWLATAAAVACVAGLGGAWLADRPDQDRPVADASFGPAGTPTATSAASPLVAAPTPAAGATTMAARSETPADDGDTATSSATTTLKVRTLSAVAGTSTRALPVYWVAPRDTTGYALYREYYTAPRVDAQEALDAMLTGRPADRDYGSPWRPAAAKVDVRDDVIVVDIGVAAFADPSVSPELARAGLQQLVYTVTAGAALQTGRNGNLPVRLLVDGRSGATVWKSVTLGEPLRRDPAAVADVWITSPVEGSVHRAGKLTVEVYGTAFEATALWSVYRTEAGAERQVAKGFVNIGSMGARAVGRFTVPVTPGDYRVRVYPSDPSDGEGPRNPEVPDDQTGDDKAISVR